MNRRLSLPLGLLALLLPGLSVADEAKKAKVSLTVASQPAQASVFVRYRNKPGESEKYVGKTPKSGPLELKLEAGAAELVVFKDGYICKVESMQLRSGGAARLEVRLTKDIPIPHRLNLKDSPTFVRSFRQSEELYVSIMAHIVRYYVQEMDPRKLVQRSVKTMVDVLNAVRSRELLLRRELSQAARRRYYGEELDLRTYPKLVFKQTKPKDGKRTYTLGAGSVAVTGVIDDDDLDSYLKMLWRVYAFLRRKWDTRQLLSDAVLVRIAIEGQLAALDDDHTHFLTPDDVQEMSVDTKGTFGGVGIVVSMRGGRLTVIAPMEGTPAQKAGVLAGDVIAAIDGKPTTRMSMKQCVERMRGKIDTPVELTIRRHDREFAVTILRARIKIKHTAHRLIGDGKKIGYLRISSFMHEKLSLDVARAIVNLISKGAQALVIDLRNNPGGLLPQAHQIADLFVPKGKIVSTRTRLAGEGRKLNANPNRPKFKLPLAVLINKGSASASEIVAGVLQEHKLATVVGQRSFGKGSVQRVLPLEPYKCALALTVATYHLPSGATPHKKGITPDIKVMLSEKQAIKLLSRTNYSWNKDGARNDPQLLKALQVLEKKLGK